MPVRLTLGLQRSAKCNELGDIRAYKFLWVNDVSFFDTSTYHTLYQQEGQHPLTGQRAASFRLLANQWAERRLVTQWCHRCRAMRRSVCNAGASNGGRSLCVQISREQSYPLPIYWYHSKGDWLRYNFAAEFIYNETLQQTFRPLLSKLSKRRRIHVIYLHFWGSYGRRRTLVDGSLESPCW